MTEAGDGDETAPSLLIECIRAPDRGKRRLPALVGLLEADDERTRLAAAWACCLVAAAHPDTVEYLVRRLYDRLDGERVSLELTHALDYLADRYPEAVGAALSDLAAEDAETKRTGRRLLPETGGFTRAHYYETEPDRRGVGRVRQPDARSAGDPRRTYVAGEPDEREIAQRRRESGAETGDAGDTATDTSVTDGTVSEIDEDAEAGDAGSNAPTEDELVGRPASVSSIAERSQFDPLHVLAAHDRDRYSIDYRALVGRGSDEQAVALRILNLPPEDAARPAFEAGVREAMDRWTAVHDHDRVVSLLDWSLEPRPWLATAFPGETLDARDVTDRRPLADAIALADAVAHTHRSDTVHGGIDSRNVVYPDTVLGETSPSPPMLTNVGLLSVYRYHVDPATVLDPRSAAPEYFDRAYGRIDARTDIYQLGAVVFALFADRPPYDGSFESVRAAVTDESVPVPGDVATGVPPGVDEAVAKAMATRKLHRYETVEHLQQDLLAVREAESE